MVCGVSASPAVVPGGSSRGRSAALSGPRVGSSRSCAGAGSGSGAPATESFGGWRGGARRRFRQTARGLRSLAMATSGSCRWRVAPNGGWFGVGRPRGRLTAGRSPTSLPGAWSPWSHCTPRRRAAPPRPTPRACCTSSNAPPLIPVRRSRRTVPVDAPARTNRCPSPADPFRPSSRGPKWSNLRRRCGTGGGTASRQRAARRWPPERCRILGTGASIATLLLGAPWVVVVRFGAQHREARSLRGNVEPVGCRSPLPQPDTPPS